MSVFNRIRTSLSNLAYRGAGLVGPDGDWVRYRPDGVLERRDGIVILVDPSVDLRRSWANALAQALESSDMAMACGPVYERGDTDRVVAAGYELGLEGETPARIPLLAGEAIRRRWARSVTSAYRPSGRVFAVKWSVLEAIVDDVDPDEEAIMDQLRRNGPWAVVWSAAQEGAEPELEYSLPSALERREHGVRETHLYQPPMPDSPGTPCLPPAAVWLGETPARLSAGLDTQELRPTVAIRHAATDWGVARRWGDHLFATALADALGERDIGGRVVPHHAWNHPFAARELVITLRGLEPSIPIVGRTNVLWVISHPEDLTPEELKGHDLIAVASLTDTPRVSAMTDTPVIPLLQATERRHFRPPGRGDGSVVFVGNRRGARRVAVDWAIGEQVPLEVYGQGWDDIEGDQLEVRSSVDRETAADRFNSASVVLGDHWEDMRRLGYVSNRVFDVAASGGLLLSDRVEGMDRILPGVPTYESRLELGERVRAWLAADTEERMRHISRLQETVLEKHTFDKRVNELFAAIRDHVPGGLELIAVLVDS